jgi:BMFP domain-containing protein YqiC
MHTNNRLFDDMARLITGAAGAAQGVREEVETLLRAQAERLIADMDLVTREEADVLRDLAANARADAERLEARVAALEERIAALEGKGESAA